MPSVLAIETSSVIGSVCLLRDYEAFTENALEDVKLSTWLLPAIDRVLQAGGIEKSELHAIAFGNGPGSFTGVRTACSTAQALAYALKKPLYSIDSMQAFAFGAIHAPTAISAKSSLNGDKGFIEVILDARMNELYRQRFSFAARNKLSAKHSTFAITAMAPPRLLLAGTGDASLSFAVGSGALMSAGPTDDAELIQQITEYAEMHWAESIAKMALESLLEGGESIAPVDACPNYVRNNVAKTELERATEAQLRARPLQSAAA
ncbi:MAG: tRNA (adenosine(37)-N6)-threonylcarbamoyltransferase complex dimerization subunit type 1 TsaB [Burkholderiales bacterium]|nr:MAG: tRNA (adenosine(37)-N6)-threonylcarbamoyltransferase complex dimerization subunit type 1 TsaB [Burkholderiales bacterium]TAG81226.1 MAG: tRNA (adenosine(37)-N6)-threonylcarbamoyltransferase complex dimerization subunit type 1 TsaB [Betaproteobacteria bacterium]